MTTKAVFLDAGHTLVYAHPSVGEIYAEVTRKHGVDLTGDCFREAFSKVFSVFVKEYSATPASNDAQDLAMWREVTLRLQRAIPALAPVPFDRWFDDIYSTFGEPGVWRTYDDVAPVLSELRRRGLKLLIVSNWDTRLRRIAAGLGLTDLVDHLLISAEAGIRKPHAGIFELALRTAGVAPDEALHVGDLLDEDIEGARRMGIPAILIDRETNLLPNQVPDGVRVIRSLRQLL